MVLIVRRDEVAECLGVEPTFAGALDVLEEAFRAHGVPGKVHTSPNEHTEIQYPPEGTAEKDLWIMPMYVPPIGCAAMRIGAAGDSLIALYDFEHMGIQAVLQDEPLGPLRSGLPLALAAKHLAKRGARTLGCIGGGPALEVAVAATAPILPIEEVVQYPVSSGSVGLGSITGVTTRRASSLEEAARTDVIFLSADGGDALRAEWLKPGQLLAAIDGRALPPEIAAELNLVYASRRHAGIEDTTRGAELGEVLRGERPGARDDEPVIFASQPDVGFCDVATAWWCFGVAKQLGLGVEVPLAALHTTDAGSL